MFDVKVLADSISLVGIRIITFLVTYPRIVHAEMMTHRMFSRNSASTRAIMLIVQIRNALNQPFIPQEFGTNKRGMQPADPLTGEKHAEAVEIWLAGRDRNLTTIIELILGKTIASRILGYNPVFGYATADTIREHLDELAALFPKTGADAQAIEEAETTILNVHKQLAGRFAETTMWHSVIVTMTGPETENFFGLRNHADAQGEIATAARMMFDALNASKPKELTDDQWHTPLVEDGEFDNLELAIKVSAARCAAVSYNRQYARVDLEDLLKRYDDLETGGHMSPLEHQARPFSAVEWAVRDAAKEAAKAAAEAGPIDEQALEQIVSSLDFNGNFRGWTSRRKTVKFEDNFSKLLKARAEDAEAAQAAELADQDAEVNSSSVA